MYDTKYCYPNSNTLINKLNIRNTSTLADSESCYTSVRLAELQLQPISAGTHFDFNYLKQIHYHIFQDLYLWAGQTRTVNIGKGNLFCLVQNIDSYAASIFGTFAIDCIETKSDKLQFIHTLSEYYSNMNALHPFREGNGRAQRELTRQLCMYCGYHFDLTVTNHQEMLSASIQSFNTGNTTALEHIFKKAIAHIK